MQIHVCICTPTVFGIVLNMTVHYVTPRNSRLHTLCALYFRSCSKSKSTVSDHDNRVCTGIMSQMVLWVHPIITGYQKTSVFQRKGVNQAYVVLRVVMVR